MPTIPKKQIEVELPYVPEYLDVVGNPERKSIKLHELTKSQRNAFIRAWGEKVHRKARTGRVEAKSGTVVLNKKGWEYEERNKA